MTWTLIRSWAKDKGFKVTKSKPSDNDELEENEIAVYSYQKNDDPTVCGSETSLSKLAKAIYNHISDNKFVEYQQNYQGFDT